MNVVLQASQRQGLPRRGLSAANLNLQEMPPVQPINMLQHPPLPCLANQGGAADESEAEPAKDRPVSSKIITVEESLIKFFASLKILGDVGIQLEPDQARLKHHPAQFTACTPHAYKCRARPCTPL